MCVSHGCRRQGGLINVVHVDGMVVAGSDKVRGDSHAVLATNFPGKIGEPTWYTGYAFKMRLIIGGIEDFAKCVY